ncbi:hypothetical protein KJ840_02005 [Patescibacteria group bacterium]|nr:hypothetical protein [Patescibacteria group bacterium]
MKKYLRNGLAGLSGLTLLLAPLLVKAQISLGIEYGSALNLGSRDVRAMVSDIINVLLGFLGIIAVVIILLGGFKWMTAGGNEDKVGEAKKLIGAGIIGLIIILAAYAIATFIVTQLAEVTY